MTNFTKKARADAEKAIGNSKIKIGTRGRTQFGGTMSNQDRLSITRSGVKDLLSGTRKSNRIKQGLPAIRRPPAAETRLASAKKKKRGAK